MEKNTSFSKAHGVEIVLLVLVLFLTGLLFHMNARLSRVSTMLENKINRVDRNMSEIKTRVEDQINMLDRNPALRPSRGEKALLSSKGQDLARPKKGIPGIRPFPGPDQSLDFRTIVDPEIESLALNWGLLRKAFPRRLQDSKRAYLDLIDQLGFPVTEQQRIQMRKVVQETFGLVECIATSAGWEGP